MLVVGLTDYANVYNLSCIQFSITKVTYPLFPRNNLPRSWFRFCLNYSVQSFNCELHFIEWINSVYLEQLYLLSVFCVLVWIQSVFQFHIIMVQFGNQSNAMQWWNRIIWLAPVGTLFTVITWNYIYTKD